MDVCENDSVSTLLLLPNIYCIDNLNRELFFKFTIHTAIIRTLDVLTLSHVFYTFLTCNYI